jgi:hypothetical protein
LDRARGAEADRGRGDILRPIPEKKCEVWIWENELRASGFRQKSERYWHCERRHGLPENAHLSIFPSARQAAGPTSIPLVEVAAFHITFRLEGEHIHFYYHEHGERTWAPGGYTSAREIARIGHKARRLRDAADRIAGALAEAMGCELLPRG